MTVAVKVREILLSNARQVYQPSVGRYRCPTCGVSGDEPETASCRGECEQPAVSAGGVSG